MQVMNETVGHKITFYKKDVEDSRKATAVGKLRLRLLVGNAPKEPSERILFTTNLRWCKILANGYELENIVNDLKKNVLTFSPKSQVLYLKIPIFNEETNEHSYYYVRFKTVLDFLDKLKTWHPVVAYGRNDGHVDATLTYDKQGNLIGYRKGV